MNTIYLENVSNMYVECTIYTMHARSIIHLIMMIIRGMHHGGIYFRWCSLLPKKARKMRRRRARSPFSLLTPPKKISKTLWIEKFPYLFGGAFELR